MSPVLIIVIVLLVLGGGGSLLAATVPDSNLTPGANAPDLTTSTTPADLNAGSQIVDWTTGADSGNAAQPIDAIDTSTSSVFDTPIVLPIFTAAQIAQVAANAGFAGSALVTAVAIALAESGGDTSNYNPETDAGTPSGQGSFGLWQIYLYKHQEYEGVDLYDPQTNANAAYAISGGGSSFRAWSTFNTYSGKTLVSVGTGPYLRYMNTAAAAAVGYA